MEHLFAVRNGEELARYQAFLREEAPRLEAYVRFLEGEYTVEELPRAVVWTSLDAATRLVSDIPVPAYTNAFRVVFTPDLDAWRSVYLRQLEGLPESGAAAEVRAYYASDLSRNNVLQILGHELAHHIALFPDDFEEYPSPSTWFEEGMAEYISRKWFLTDGEFAAEERANRQLVELLRSRYGARPLETFGARLEDGGYAGLFFDYWRAFLAVRRAVENCGGVREAFVACRRWYAEGAAGTLAEQLGVY